MGQRLALSLVGVLVLVEEAELGVK